MFLSKTVPLSVRTTSFLKVSRIHTSLFHSNRIVNSAIEETTFPSNVTTIGNNNAALYAFGSRLGLQDLDSHILEQAVTSSTFSTTENNDALSVLGRHVTLYYTMEYLHSRYPKLPTSVFKRATNAYTSLKSIASVGQQIGLQHIMRWERPQVIEDKIKDGHQYAVSNCVNAIIGAIHQQKGSEAAKQFVHDFILSREMKLSEAFKDIEPKRHLSALMKRLEKESPISRLLSETGRHSSSPVFVIGVFSGQEKLGEGFGSSKKMAEHRACRDALINYYAQEEKDFHLPSDADRLENYHPPVLADTEVII